MGIRIYNSLTKRKEEFKPIREGRVGMYVCGVTVYDECHIGHARSAFIFDVIVRYFRFRGYDVRYVRNITDVDDKIINRAREELQGSGSKVRDLKDKVKGISQRYLGVYRKDMQALGIGEPDIEPKATEHIAEMLELINTLLEKKIAYKVDGNVYFEVKKFSDYGKLSKQSLDQMQAGARVEVDERKKDPLDFALWKASKENEPSWSSPWGEGRPGWHIECSSMSMKYLGQNFDIHCGGRDLIFPHHENEIAQSEASTGKKFANIWIHNGLLTINGEKMSKSLGNFVSISEILERYHPEVLKIFFLSAHYGGPIDFTFEKMDEAQRARERFYILFEKINRAKETAGSSVEKKGKAKSLTFEVIAEVKERFKQSMDDDFNTTGALASLFDLVNCANKFLQEKTDLDAKDLLLLNYSKKTLIGLGKVLGLFTGEEPGKITQKDKKLKAIVEYIVRLRDEMRARKDFEQADKIRVDLSELGIILEDEKEGTSWRIV